MGLGSALSTAISGLNANQTTLDVIGNNLANSNTPAFKAFRAQFVNNFLNTVSLGATPSAINGGTNPRQFGQGSRVTALGVDFSTGSPTQTSVASDLYIQGDGFFVVKAGTDQLYTRDGSFNINSNAELITASGLKVQGFGIDDDFNILPTSLVDLTIPLGSLTIAKATTVAFMEGDLNPIGDLATQGTINQSEIMTDTATAAPPTAATLLSDLEIVNPLGNIPVINEPTFIGGSPIQVTYTPRKFGRVLSPQTMTLDPATTTVGEFLNFITGSLGIDTSLPPAGATILPTGELQITGNFGQASDFTISSNDFELPDNLTGTINLDFIKSQTANGESVFGQFAVFDSLGAQVTVGVTAYLEMLGNESSTFRLLFESPDQRIATPVPPATLPLGIDSIFDKSVGNAVVTFDEDGQLLTVTGNDLTVLRQNTGATDPLQFRVDVSQVSALAVRVSRLAVVSQDGSSPGTLIDYSIDSRGVVQGAFDNGQIRNLGQVVLARFNNPSGLINLEGNTYREGPNSGLPFVTEPGAGVGTVLSGFLELSNVDIGSSFVSLLTASTAFSANSRVIATSQDLFQTLLGLPR